MCGASRCGPKSTINRGRTGQSDADRLYMTRIDGAPASQGKTAARPPCRRGGRRGPRLSGHGEQSAIRRRTAAAYSAVSQGWRAVESAPVFDVTSGQLLPERLPPMGIRLVSFVAFLPGATATLPVARGRTAHSAGCSLTSNGAAILLAAATCVDSSTRSVATRYSYN